MKSNILHMKKTMCTNIIVLLLSIIGIEKGCAQNTFIVDDLIYSINNNQTSVTVIGHVDSTSATGWLTIPEMVTYNNIEYPVVSIGSNAFRECQGLTELLIGDSVKTIGHRAFYLCKGITGPLYIPDGVVSIGTGAFASCSGFTGPLIIPKSVKVIDAAAFAWCSGFTGSLIIPESVTYLGPSAFMMCSGFTGPLVLPESLTYIPYWAFYGCSGLSGSLNLPDSLTYIDKRAFCECSGLTGPLFLPYTLDSICEYAFYGCSGFTGPLTLPNTLTSIGTGAFAYCSGLSGELTLPDSITEIKEATFYNCSNLTGNLNLGEKVTSIGVGAFGYCRGFTGSLTIPNAVCEIAEGSFCGCTGLNGTLSIPNAVTSIGGYAFSNCSGLTGSLILPDALVSMDEFAFYNCSGFTGSLVIPSHVHSIGKKAFSQCNGFDSAISLNTTPPSLGQSVFSEISCTALTVPCSCVSTYEASPWNGCFATISEDCTPFPVSVDLNIVGGVVTSLLSEATMGQEVTFTAIPNANMHVASVIAFNTNNPLQTILVSPVDETANPTFKFNMPIFGVTISATFEQNVYSINISQSILGGDVSASVLEATPGELVTLEVIPDPGYELLSLTVYNAIDTNQIVPVTNNTFFMPAFDVLVSASFEEAFYHISIRPSIIGGDVTPSATAARMGETISLLVTPNSGYELMSLTVYNAVDTTQTVPVVNNTFTMPSFDVMVSVLFEKAFYYISIRPSIVGGMVTPSATKAMMGDTISISVTPNYGYELLSLIVCNAIDDSQTVPIINNTFIMPPFDVMVSASFNFTSVDENIASLVSVSPNPTNGNIIIEAEDLKHVTISNTLGQIIYEGNDSGDMFEFDFGMYGAGLYLIRIETADGVALKKVSVAR